MIELGQSVRTTDGKSGTVVAPNSGGNFTYYRRGGTELSIPVYAVELDDGEVRFYMA